MTLVFKCHFCLVLVAIATLSVAVQGQNFQLMFTIPEERPKETFVGNVFSDQQFVSQVPPEDLNSIRFGFLKQSFIQSLFTIQETSGIIYTATVLDRESRDVCQSQTLCSLSFSIAVRSVRPQSSYFAIITVTIIIEDINDNAPRFPQDVLNLDISESTTVGTSFHIESSIDSDFGNYSVQSYEIGKQDGDFSLDIIKKLDGSFTIKLVLNSPLDREAKDRYNVVIIAWDGGNPRKFGALTVNITVTDVNDNAPVFLQNEYNVTIRENATIGMPVLRISGVDRDTGLNGQISYRLSQNQLDGRVEQFFTIVPMTGDITLLKKLVYEERSYRIIAEAIDSGSQPHVTQIIINVHVVNVGNNPPVLEINLLGQENSRIVNISEAASPGTFVAHINVFDSDTGENGRLECEISDRKFELQSMSARGFKVVVKGALDRESQDLHQILVSCHDFGKPPLSASSSFLVSVDDINDCAPVFTQPVYTGTIPENHKDFRTFVQIIAFDEDLGKGGDVRYYIDQESTDKKFWIDEMDGNLRADQEFDRETDQIVVFKIIARDLGLPSLSNKAIVKLTISDKNDNAPVIMQPTTFSIMENKNSDSFVGALLAEDADDGENARTMFLIQPEFEFNVPFVVFPDGKIKTNRQLDRELQSKYEFGVVVFDQGTPRLKSSASVTVIVNDSNDNAPIIKFPVTKNNTAIVYSDVNPGHKVTQIYADDSDDAYNGIVSYDITSGNSEDLFVIDNKLGGIYITRKVSVSQNKTYQLKIAVKDGGTPQHKTECDLNIVLVKSVNSSSTENDQDSNTMIVVVVVSLTAVLSVVLIIVICFLRRFDHRSKAHRNLDVVAPDDKYPKCYMDNPSRYLGNGQDSLDHLTLTYDPIMSPVVCSKKKEVSFDIDDSTERTDLRDHHNTTMSTFSMPESEKGLSTCEEGEECSPDQNGRLNKIQLLQYHQAVLESQTRAWLRTQDGHDESSSFEVTMPDDKYSDTSEEVTASDSGKGGSEDDIPSNHSKDLKNRVANTSSQVSVNNKFQTHHYVAPEFRRQGSLQRKACDINFGDICMHSPASPLTELPNCRPESRASLAHSIPRPNSQASAAFYPKEGCGNMTIDSALDQSASWDAASYV
ncbi:protocadherin gamma-B4-like isoform X2 [Dreissena polymorpha]|uniref:protocadherin gamma-B4-like isoform X2 n=1 Tax=Dreissena polymorpha TaxID=45954 RepID=UPI00226456B0|nr:protocadherin gamma-B4-like isoform X2 [Dreissena polymorpha]